MIEVKSTTLAFKGVFNFLAVDTADTEWRLGDIRLPP